MAGEDPDLAFRLLGPLDIFVRGAPVALRAAKVRTLLAVLLVHANRVVSAERLLDVLWGDEPPASATNTLQTYVSQLRRLLGPGHGAGDGRDLLQNRPPGYLLVIGDQQLDALCFERLAAAGHRMLGAEPERAAATLRSALALWRGPALADFADQPFAVGEAARLEEARLAALEERITADLVLGRHGGLIGELEALAVAHPHRDHIAGHLMLALYRSGRQADALRAYQRLRLRLGEDLGLDPSPALLRLEAAVLAQAPELDLPESGQVILRGGPAQVRARFDSDLDWIPSARFPFVGRSRECAVLSAAALDDGDDLRVVLVRGDPGTGKTRLVAEAAAAAADHGQWVLYGRADEHLSDAYRLFLRALHRVHPDRDPWPAADAAPIEDADARRMRFFAAASATLSSSSPRRLVLVLDDLQWADVPSLLLLRHVLLDAPRFPLTVLAVLGLGRAAPVLSATVEQLRRVDVLSPIDLGGLDQDDVGRLVEESPARLDRKLVHRLWSDTGGNPLYVTEVLRELCTGSPDPAWPRLPATVPEVVGRRTRSLSPATQALLAGAAVVGRAAGGPLLGRVAALDDVATIAALDEAVESRLLGVVPGEEGSFQIDHGMVQAAIYNHLPVAARLDLHRRVALALEAEGEGRGRPAELARHWLAAGAFGDPVLAIEYLRAAGDAADRRTGYEAAVGHYRAALELMDRHPVDPVARTTLLLALAATENRSGDVNAGKEACRAAAEVAGSLGRGDLLAHAALEYGGVLPTGTAVDDDPDAAGLLRRALSLVEADTVDAALVAARLAELEYWDLARAQRRSLCDQAEATVRRAGEPAALAEVLLCRYWAMNGPDETEDLHTTVQELEGLAAASGDRELTLRAGKCRLHLLLELGRFDDACLLADGMARTAAELNHPEHLRLATAFDAMRAGARGDYDDAARLIVEARSLMERRGHPQHAAVAAFFQELPERWLRGRLGDVVTQADFLAQLQPARPFWRALLGWAAAEGGDLARATSLLANVDLARFTSGDRRLDWWTVLTATANVALAVDDAVAAAVVYEALLPYAGRNLVGGQVAFYGTVAHVLGALAGLVGDQDAAVTHLEAAFQRHEAMGATPFVALTAAEMAGLRSVPPDRAQHLTDLAAGIAGRLGLAHVERRLGQASARRATA